MHPADATVVPLSPPPPVPLPTSVPTAHSSAQRGCACLDWRMVAALGVSEQDAKTIVQELVARQMVKRYRRQLVQAGLNPYAATHIAQAIAYYDAFEQRPTMAQLRAMTRYYSTICRAQLWRSAVLPPPPTEECLLS